MTTVVQFATMMTEPPKQQATYGFTVRDVLLPPVDAKPLKGALADSPGKAAASAPAEQQSPHTPQQHALPRSQLTSTRSGRAVSASTPKQQPDSRRAEDPSLRSLAANKHQAQHLYQQPRQQHSQRRQIPPPSPHRSSRQSRSPSREHGGGQHHAETADEQPESSFGIRGLMSITSGSFTPADLSTHTAKQPQPHLEVVGTTHASPDVRRLVRAVTRGLRCCQEPEAAETGLGGTYFFRSEAGAHVAIVKPCDEEPLAPNNPKGFVGRELGHPGLKPTVRVGEAALREVAAFLLDHQNFAKVPPTVLVRVSHPIFHQAVESTPLALRPTDSGVSLAGPGADADGALMPEGKLGSLQEFVMHDGDTSEVGASRFSVADVHRIGILDVRLFNTDRHAGNMLVVRPRDRGSRSSMSGGRASAGGGLARLEDARSELRPIDHGFCLPEALEPPYFEWLHWPQAMMPFSEEELKYIAALDPAADCELLRRELPALRPECGRTLQVATALLQAAAAAGLSLAEIGEVMSRPLVGMEEEASQLERLCLACRAAIDSADSASETDGSTSDADSCGSSERSWPAGHSGSDASDEDADADGSEDTWSDDGLALGPGFGHQGLGRLSSRSARGGGSSSLADISEDGSAMSSSRNGEFGSSKLAQMANTSGRADNTPSRGGHGGGDQFGGQLLSLGLSDAPRMLAPAGGSLQRLDSWQRRGSSIGVGDSGGRRDSGQFASVSDLASVASGTLMMSTRRSAADDLLFELDDGGPSHIAGAGVGCTAAAAANGAAAAAMPLSMARTRSSPVGSMELLPQLSLEGGIDGAENGRRRASIGDTRMSPRTPAAAAYADRGMGLPWHWADSSSPDTPSPDAAAAGASAFGGSSPFMLPSRPPAAFQNAAALPPSRPKSAMGGLGAGGRGGFQYADGSAAAAATEGPMAMSLALPSMVQRPRRLTHQRRHHRHGHHKAKRQAPAVYPPPIEGRAPTAVNAVFSGLDAAQWVDFMALLRQGIDAALKAGDWRAGRAAPNGRATAPAGGTSCPRF